MSGFVRLPRLLGQFLLHHNHPLIHPLVGGQRVWLLGYGLPHRGVFFSKVSRWTFGWSAKNWAISTEVLDIVLTRFGFLSLVDELEGILPHPISHFII